MKKFLFILVAYFMAIGKLYADDFWEYAYVFAWSPDGKCTVYKCVDEPVLIPQEEGLAICVNGEEVQIIMDGVCKFTFSKTGDVDTVVPEVLSKGVCEVTKNTVTLTGIDGGVKMAGVYSTDGKHLLQGKVSDGSVSLNISGLKSGVYVVQCGSVNFKFLKK